MSDKLSHAELVLAEIESSFLQWRSDLEKGNYDGLEESALAYHQNLRSFLDNNEISKLADEIQQGLQQLLSEQQSLSKRIVQLKDDTAEKIMALRKGRNLNSTYHSPP